MTMPIPEETYRAVSSVYIVEPQDHGWIIERLMRDIARELADLGVVARIGPHSGYAGEDVIFNSRFLIPLSDSRARVRSLFITHLDDQVKEMELRSRSKQFNSLVCLSGQEADFISGVLERRTGIVGIDLPARDLVVAPLRLALFTARYEDHRKNEQWLLDYFQDKGRDHKDNFVICLMGWGWEPFCTTLSDLEMNYEIYRYSRFTPGEYGMYKAVLPSMDCLAYLGFDGGAMCVYDAVAAGVDVLATDISYHRGLGDSVSLIGGREDFFREMDRLHAYNLGRKAALGARSIQPYVARLLAHWNEVANAGAAPPSVAAPPSADEAAAMQIFRSHYKPVGPRRLRSFAIRALQAFMARSA